RATNETQRHNAAVLDGLAKVKRNTDDRQKEHDKLVRDLAHYKAEEKMITSHAASLEKEVAGAKSDLQRASASNHDLDFELVSLTHQAAEIINRRAPPVESPSK